MQSTAQTRKKSCVLCSQLHKLVKTVCFMQPTVQNLKQFVLSAIIWLSLPKNRPFLPITAKTQTFYAAKLPICCRYRQFVAGKSQNIKAEANRRAGREESVKPLNGYSPI